MREIQICIWLAYIFPLCFMLQLLLLYSPVFNELFANAEKGVVEELPVVKLENESATDIRTLLDMLYPDTNHVVNGMFMTGDLNKTIPCVNQ